MLGAQARLGIRAVRWPRGCRLNLGDQTFEQVLRETSRELSCHSVITNKSRKR